MTGLAINGRNVVHETIDGETIVIHMGTGTYYSLEDEGSELWSLIEHGADRGALLDYSLERWDGERAEIESAVCELLDELIGDGLVVETDGATGSGPAPLPSPPGRDPFAAPVLHRFTDMQEFMIVDPLHDVDAEAGWPHVGSR
ncbi:MAG TPA: PqqD family protein [Solirubrobacteraceae bacterium]|nr:PqqD family protein [Solirubrobacteraceae bacterium]